MERYQLIRPVGIYRLNAKISKSSDFREIPFNQIKDTILTRGREAILDKELRVILHRSIIYSCSKDCEIFLPYTPSPQGNIVLEDDDFSRREGAFNFELENTNFLEDFEDQVFNHFRDLAPFMISSYMLGFQDRMEIRAQDSL